MSLDQSGLYSHLQTSSVCLEIKETHPLIRLSNTLDWSALAKLVLSDLQATTKKNKWWLGRPLRLRIHLGAYLLQHLYHLTDRGTEYAIQDNAAFRLFCGWGVVKHWHTPDHTKIESFRSRLSPETQKQLANEITRQAVVLGFADPSHIDIDSTVQEANMHYPTDSHLLCKLGSMAKRVADYKNTRKYTICICTHLQLILAFACK